ncbi:MAG: thioredoxin domain-containing protein [Myxococcota bacterium]|nr:thioredoxin domain-containing protein [Myxococcota bacterium]
MNKSKNAVETMSVTTLLGMAAAAALLAGGLQFAMAAPSSAPAAGSSRLQVTKVVLADGARAKLGKAPEYRSRGAKIAKAELVVYGDFASPFAATSGRVVDAVLEQFKDDLSVSYRHFISVDNHTSVSAAQAAEAAAKLGKFSQFRELAFGRNDGLGYVDFTAWAGPLGLGDVAFRKAMEAPETGAAVAADSAQAEAMGLTQRPTFFLNGVQLPGTTPINALSSLLEKELAAAQAAGGLAALLKTEPFDTEGVDTGTLEQKKEGQARFGEAKVRISDADPSWGNSDATVTIVEFGDFLCPYCRRGAEALGKIKKKYGPEKVRIVFKNLPLRMHRYADVAARGVLAAGRQGKFWEMHGKLYTRQKDLKSGGVDAILGFALELGLDLDTLMDDMTSVEIREKVADDMAEAERMGVRFTPNYFINDEHIGGALPYNNFVQIIDKHMSD